MGCDSALHVDSNTTRYRAFGKVPAGAGAAGSAGSSLAAVGEFAVEQPSPRHVAAVTRTAGVSLMPFLRDGGCVGYSRTDAAGTARLNPIGGATADLRLRRRARRMNPWSSNVTSRLQALLAPQ